MFSQFRNVVENFAQHQISPSSSGSTESDVHDDTSRRSGSFDLSNAGRTIALSTELAGSALTNLIRPFGSQSSVASGNSQIRTGVEGSSSKLTTNKMTGIKLNLEDRLRASLNVDTSNPNSRSASPQNLTAVIYNVIEPKPESEFQLLSPVLVTPDVKVQSEKNTSLANIVSGLDINVLQNVYIEANIPLPPSPPIGQRKQVSETPDLVIESDTDYKDVEVLRERIKIVEGRLFDVSESFRQLQSQKSTVDELLRDFSGMKEVGDIAIARESLLSSRSRMETEIEKLLSVVAGYDDKMKTIRSAHDEQNKINAVQEGMMRKRLDETESLLESAQKETDRLNTENKKQRIDLEHFQNEIKKLNGVVKDEEEKRTKAVSLLKTVRQKLVKAEKDRDDSVQEMASVKEKEKAEFGKEKKEKLKLECELDAMRLDRTKETTELKAQFEIEMATLKEDLEREFATHITKAEAEANSLKTIQYSERVNNLARITELEAIVLSLNEEKGIMFDQLQMRQAEVEFLHSHLETLQSSKEEVQYQLRNTMGKISLMTDELTEFRLRENYHVRPDQLTHSSSDDLLAIEVKYEARLNEIHSKLLKIETERNETEVTLNRNLEIKNRENESLNNIVNLVKKDNSQMAELVSQLKLQAKQLSQEIKSYRREIDRLVSLNKKLQEDEIATRDQMAKLKGPHDHLVQELQEMTDKEAQVKSHNKTLHEELRKIQASVALLEHQRKPGVGFWNSSSPTNESSSHLGQPNLHSDPSRQQSSEGEINLQYLRNIILQFLEHKDMRPQLVQVLSIILQFTPQETRRLIANTRTA